MVVYIKTQGARIIKEGRHLLVKKGEDTYHTLFTYKLRQIVILANRRDYPTGRLPRSCAYTDRHGVS